MVFFIQTPLSFDLDVVFHDGHTCTEQLPALTDFMTSSRWGATAAATSEWSLEQINTVYL